MANIIINSSINVELTWTEFKEFINGNQKSLFLQFIESSGRYELFAQDADIVYTTTIITDASQFHGLTQSQIDQHNQDKSDFEDNFKSNGNRTIGTFTQLQDFGGLDPKSKRPAEEWRTLQVLSGTNPTIEEFTWNYDVSIQSALTYANWGLFNTGDTIDTIFIPINDGLIGSITSSLSSGDTIIDVEQSVIDNLVEGDHVIIGTESRKRVINVDENNLQITLEVALDSSHGSGEDVKKRFVLGSSFRFLQDAINQIASRPFGSIDFPEGSKLRVEYHHAVDPTSDATIPFGIALHYGRLLK